MRCIPIKDCSVCPSRDHKGGHGSPAYVPVCRKANRELPWNPVGDRSGRVTATPTYTIPDWCPLPDTGDVL